MAGSTNRCLRPVMTVPGPISPVQRRAADPGLDSVLVSFTLVRSRSPAVGQDASEQVTDGSDSRRMVVNVVGKRVGATLASSNLASSATLTCKNSAGERTWMTAGQFGGLKCGPLSGLDSEPRKYGGRPQPRCCARSWMVLDRLNGRMHAAQAFGTAFGAQRRYPRAGTDKPIGTIWHGGGASSMPGRRLGPFRRYVAVVVAGG